MLPNNDQRKISRRQRRGLVLVATIAVVVLGGLYELSRPGVPGLPALKAPLFWMTPTSNTVVLLVTRDPSSSPPPVPGVGAVSTPSPAPLPPWLSGYPTPGRPDESGPTSTPSTWLIFLPGVSFMPTPTPELKVEPPPVPPTPRWPDGLSSQTASKLGLHVVRNSDPYIMEFVRRVRPRVMKAVDDVGWLADVKQASPNTITIGRLSGQNESWPEQLAPDEAAREYIDAHLSQYRVNTGVDYWEGWNEFVPVTTARWQWYAQFEAARACQMQALGLHAAIGGFVGGAPQWNEIPLFIPAIQAAQQCGAILTMHEGVSPLPGCGVFNDVADVIPGAPAIPGKTVGYLMLRYRFWYEGYLKGMGLGNVPLVISELAVGGIVPGQACNGPGGSGWKGFTNFWVANGIGSDGPHAWANLLAWYDSEIRQDDYVIGTTIFTAGAQGDGRWDSEDLHEVIIPLAYYETSQK